MATFKNISGTPRDIPALDLHVPADGTVEIPDELAHSFENDTASWSSSRVKNADVTADPAVVEAATAVPTEPAPAAPAAPTN